MTSPSRRIAGACAVAVMAKAPRLGTVKTRLSPPLTREAAVALSAAFLRDITENVAAASKATPIHGYVAFAPEGDEALFDGMLADGTRLVLADGDIDAPADLNGIGRSLLHAATTLCARHHAVCMVNSDSPTLPTAILVEAAEVLAEPGDRVVLGPAEDGGYYLIGMKTPHPGLFENIAWSTAAVAGQTRQRARALEIEVVELAPWYDVDDRVTLLRLLGDLDDSPRARGHVPYPAPATAACVKHLDLRRLLASSEPLAASASR